MSDGLALALMGELSTHPGLSVNARIVERQGGSSAANTLSGGLGARTFSVECTEHRPPTSKEMHHGITAAFERRVRRLGYVPSYAPGPHYAMRFGWGDVTASATTRSAEVARQMIIGWCDGASLDEMRGRFTGWDGRQRALEYWLGLFEDAYFGCPDTHARILPGSILPANPSNPGANSVWVGGPVGFGCEVDPLEHDDVFWCGLRVEGNEVAGVLLEDEATLEALVGSWTRGEVCLTELLRRCPHARVSPYASRDPQTGAWSWDADLLRWEAIRDATADRGHAYHDMHRLYCEVVKRPTLRKLHHFTSMHTLCFCRSRTGTSYTRELPTISPPGLHWDITSRFYIVGYEGTDTELSLIAACDLAEAIVNELDGEQTRSGVDVPLRVELEEALKNCGVKARLTYDADRLVLTGHDLRIFSLAPRGDPGFCSVLPRDEGRLDFSSCQRAAEWIARWLSTDDTTPTPNWPWASNH